MPEEKKEPKKCRYGFVCLNRKETFQTEQQSCLALVSVADEDFSFFFLDEVLLFGFSPVVAAEKIVPFNVRLVGIDIENYDWLVESWDKQINLAYKQRPDRRGRLPILRSYERDKDPLIRQLSSVEDLLVGKRISISKHLQENKHINPLISAWGDSVVADAVAGAIMVGKEQAEILKLNQSMQRMKK